MPVPGPAELRPPVRDHGRRRGAPARGRVTPVITASTRALAAPALVVAALHGASSQRPARRHRAGRRRRPAPGGGVDSEAVDARPLRSSIGSTGCTSSCGPCLRRPRAWQADPIGDDPGKATRSGAQPARRAPPAVSWRATFTWIWRPADAPASASPWSTPVGGPRPTWRRPTPVALEPPDGADSAGGGGPRGRPRPRDRARPDRGRARLLTERLRHLANQPRLRAETVLAVAYNKKASWAGQCVAFRAILHLGASTRVRATLHPKRRAAARHLPG